MQIAQCDVRLCALWLLHKIHSFDVQHTLRTLFYVTLYSSHTSCQTILHDLTLDTSRTLNMHATQPRCGTYRYSHIPRTFKFQRSMSDLSLK